MRKSFRFGLSISLTVLASFVLAWLYTEFVVRKGGVPEISQAGFVGIDGIGFGLAFFTVIVVALLYALTVRDLSETIAIIVAGYWALFSGLEDFFVYLLIGGFEESYPWLEDTTVSVVADFFNEGVVTTPMLVGNIVFTGLIAGFLIYLLYKLEDRWGVIEI